MRDDVALFEEVEGALLEVVHAGGGRRGGWRVGAVVAVLAGGAAVTEGEGVAVGGGGGRGVGGDEPGVVVVREDHALGEEGLDDGLAVFGWDEDEVRVWERVGVSAVESGWGYRVGLGTRTVRRDEEDRDISQRQRRRQLGHPRPGVHARAIYAEGGVRVLGDGDLPYLVLSQAFDGGLEDGLGPGRLADDGALDRRDAYVEEPMAVVLKGHVLSGDLGGVLAGWEKDLEDGLEKVGVEFEGYVDEAQGAFLRDC